MPPRPRQRRVAMINMLSERAFDQLALGVLEYAEHAAHWTFAGQAYWPFVPLDQVRSDRIDGVIGNFHEPQWLEAILRTGVTAVTTSNRFAELALPRVGHDESAIGRLGAEHLLGRGCAHFGFAGLAHVWFSRQRFEAFRSVVQRAGRSCHLLDDLTYEGGDNRGKIRAWLDGLPKPIGILAVAEHFGAPVIEAATDLGLRVPEDVAVLSVGNDWRTTAMTHPPMSSITLDARQVGYLAARMLDRRMSGREPDSPQWVPPLGLAARRSTQAALADDPLVVDALRFIRDHCHRALRVADLLDHLHVSQRTLENRMKRSIGRTPQVAIQRAQIERAQRVLQSSRGNLGEVAEACGFDRQDQFCTVFKRLTGMTPGQYRRRHPVSQQQRK